jgi:DNA-binding response OmpR family regulator
MRVLLVESSKASRSNSLYSQIKEQGYSIDLAHSPADAAQQCATRWPGCVVINMVVGNLDLEAIKRALLETHLDIPKLIVDTEVAQRSMVDVTPLSELIEKIADVKNRWGGRYLDLGNMVLDTQERLILRGGQVYSLTPKEMKLLLLLVNHRDEVLSRKMIMQQVWDTDYMGDTRTLDVHIRWLREKIEVNPSRPLHLQTIRGVGYRLVIESEAS